MVTRSQARHAVQEADRLLDDLGVDQGLPVDVFDIVDQLGLWLVFNRLDNLLGAVIPRGDGGIMLSTQRGAAVQRYTAAHEIGHWVLDYGEASFDTEDDVYHPAAERELLAQIFASHLLMPPPLVYAVGTRYGVHDARTATPAAVYLMARDLGASYEAAARQLANLEIINRTRRDELLRVKPATIKTELCRGHRPTGPVDVWPIGLDAAGTALTVTEGDEIVLLLPENRTTGYRWLTDDDLERRDRHAVSEPPAIDEADTVGAPRGWRPSRSRPPAPAAAVEQALDRLPGNAGAVRILPPPGPAAAGDRPPQAGHTVAVVDDQFLVSRGAVAASQRRATRRAIARGGQAPPGGAAHVSSLPTPGGPRPAVSIAGTGTRLLALRSVSEGPDAVQLVYSSAHDPAAAPVETYRLDVQVTPAPEVLRRRAYLDVDLDQAEPDGDELQ